MPAQWWKLPMLCVFSWNVGMCVSDVQHLRAVGTHISFDLLSTIQDIFPFVVFDYWLDPVIIFDIFPGCILLVTFRLITSFRSFFFLFKEVMSKHNCTFFSPSCLLFLFWMNVTVIHQALYIFIFLPFLLSVDCSDHFVSVMVSHVWISIQVTCLSKKALFTLKYPLIYTVPFECEKTCISACVGMCWLGSLMGDCSLISLSFEYCLWT